MRKKKESKSNEVIRVCIIGTRRTKATQEKTRGLLRFAAEAPNWEIHFAFNEMDAGNLRETMKHWMPDAVIIYSTLYVSAIGPLVGTNIPIAAVDINVGGRAEQKAFEKKTDIFVQIDDAAVARSAANCLIRRGFTNFAYFGPLDKNNQGHSILREASFATQIAKKGGGYAVYPVPEKQFANWGLEEPRIITWLKSLPLPCGIMAYNDLRGKQLLDACRHVGLNVPSQVAVIGVDNDVEICESTQPRLSSVAPNFELSGYTAARLLDEKIRKRSSGRKRVIYGVLETVERESTQDYSGGARLVSMAEAYIGREACNGVSVRDVAAVLHVSPRLLEMRFRSILGETVLSRIQRVKLEKVQRLLLKTSLQIKEIGPLCGFQNDVVLKARFKKKFGCSMRDFRESRGRILSAEAQGTLS